MSEHPTAEQIADALAVLRCAGWRLEPPREGNVEITVRDREQAERPRRLLVLAGTQHQARHWLHEQPEDVRRRAVVIGSANSVRGYAHCDVVRVGDWRERRDLTEVEQMLEVICAADAESTDTDLSAPAPV